MKNVPIHVTFATNITHIESARLTESNSQPFDLKAAYNKSKL